MSPKQKEIVHALEEDMRDNFGYHPKLTKEVLEKILNDLAEKREKKKKEFVPNKQHNKFKDKKRKTNSQRQSRKTNRK